MALVAYGRVSTGEQRNSLEGQRQRFTELGVDPDLIFIEAKSGKSAKDRPKLQEMLRTIRKGDKLVITRIDRLARSSVDLHRILETVRTKGAEFQALDQPDLNMSTSTGKLLLAMLGAIAEFEKDLINERRSEGVRRAVAKGVRFGPKPKVDDAVAAGIRADRAAGKMIREIMAERKLSKATVYRVLGG
jgi:DNA invertase Pin-like site-specific DNA recombinase